MHYEDLLDVLLLRCDGHVVYRTEMYVVLGDNDNWPIQLLKYEDERIFSFWSLKVEYC